MRLTGTDLACRRAGRLVFSGIGFTVSSGGLLAIVGRNGAGKSSLLAMLMGRLAPEAGRIAVEDAGDRSLLECIHFVGHRDGLKAALTVSENLAFATDILGEPGIALSDALTAVGLAHAADLPVAYLSAGQRRRIALARLLVAKRPIWLLDEPTSALDARSHGIVADLVRRHLSENGLAVVATHQSLGVEGEVLDLDEGMRGP